MNIFTFCDDFNIKCNCVIFISRNAIVLLIQSIIELIIQNHDMFKTILLSDCFVTFKCNFFQ